MALLQSEAPRCVGHTVGTWRWAAWAWRASRWRTLLATSSRAALYMLHGTAWRATALLALMLCCVTVSLMWSDMYKYLSGYG